MDDGQLVKRALQAREMAYAPYSHWKVGAALLCKDGTIYTGCNIENSGFSATVCAERCAIFKAVSDGQIEFTAIAIAGGDEKAGVVGYCYPCGVCRQVMSEFCSGDFKIIVGVNENNYVVNTLAESLPNGFFEGKDQTSYFRG